MQFQNKTTTKEKQIPKDYLLLLCKRGELVEMVERVFQGL
jgi:hypothetical protein